MLVVGRNVGQSIVIDGRITVTVLRIMSDDQVRLGISAPPDVPVHRKEVQNRINAGVPFKKAAQE